MDTAVVEAPGAPPAWVLDPRADQGMVPQGSAVITAKFFMGPDPRPDGFGQTVIRDDGSIPVVEMVEINNLNDPKNSPMIMIATDHHRYRRREEGGFPAEYQAFKSGLVMEASGTPLRDWLGENSRTKNLASFNVYTVEQLVEASDSLCQTLGPGTYDLRTKAKAYLLSRQGSAEAERVAAENEVLRNQMADMQATLARLSAVVDAKQASPYEQPVEQHPAEMLDPSPQRRGPGRPRANQE